MTVLSACQTASRLMGLSAPTQVYGSTSRYEIELQAIANEAAKSIAKSHDWRKFTTLKTQAGDGSDTSFALPSDYDRMPVKAAVWLTSSEEPMLAITDLDQWLRNRLENFTPTTGEWIILGGELQIYPAMASTDSAKFYYQSNKIVMAEDASTKTEFTVDTDSFRLDERMLALEIIWRWRSMKGLEYAEDMQNAEIAKSQEIARDKGSRILSIGRVRMPDDAAHAYPFTLSAS